METTEENKQKTNSKSETSNTELKAENKSKDNSQISVEEETEAYDSKVKILQESLDLETKEAEQALELANGDVNKAQDMVDFVEKSYIIIHGKFNYGGYNKTYGLFYLIADGKDGELLKQDSLLSSNNKLWSVDLEVSNQAFVKTLSNYTPLKGTNLKLSRSLSPAEIFDLYKFTKENTIGELRALIEDKLEEKLEVAIELKIHSTLKTKPQLENIYPSLFEEESDSETDNSESDNEGDNSLGLDLTLKCLPVVSPTQGKRPPELNSGERLLVKIVDNTELGNYFRNLLSNDSGLTTGIIEEINLRSTLNSYNIKIKFGPDIYGKVVVGTEIKIVSNPEDEVLTEEQPAKEKNNQEWFNPLFLILLGTIFVLIIILISLYV